MRKALLLFVMAGLSYEARCQGTFTICEPQEFCFCWNGAGTHYTWTFLPCADSAAANVSVMFCGGNMSSPNVLTSYNGADINSMPIFPLSGNFPDLHGLTGTSGGGALYMEFNATESMNSCGSGALEPWRFIVFVGSPDPLPTVDGCTATGPSCLSTGIPAGEPVRAGLSYANGVVQFARSVQGSLEIHEPSGRLLRTHPLNGERSSSIGPLPSGVYLLTLISGGQRTSERIVVAD